MKFIDLRQILDEDNNAIICIWAQDGHMSGDHRAPFAYFGKLSDTARWGHILNNFNDYNVIEISATTMSKYDRRNSDGHISSETIFDAYDPDAPIMQIDLEIT